MEEKATRVYAGLTGVISSIVLCGIYVYLHTVPFFRIDNFGVYYIIQLQGTNTDQRIESRREWGKKESFVCPIYSFIP